jgi:uncharacterized membrane protein
MTEEPVAKIERILSEGSDFKFSDYISRGFAILQKNLGGFIGYTAIFLVLYFVIGLIPFFVGPFANMLVVGPAMITGFYLVARKLDRGERTEFGDFFRGFDFTGQLALGALVTNLFTWISVIPFLIVVWDSGLVEWYMDVLANPTEQPGIPDLPPAWSLLLLLPSIYLSIAYAWTFPFVALYGMGFWDAMEASRRMLTKHWFIYFLFSMVVGLIVFAGIFLLCVGLLATIPAAFCMIYAAFADVTKLNEETSEGDGIERHLIS